MMKEKYITDFRRREKNQRTEHVLDGLLIQAKDRLTAANEAIRTTRNFFFALLSIAAYIGVVVWGTTDEQLLRISPVKLPIINVDVPLTGFYTAVPALFVLLHFNLLIHLAFTSRKLKVFLDRLKLLDCTQADDLRNDVLNFPLAQWMVGKHDRVLHVILSLFVWIMLILIPPFLLLWMQLRFLSFQNEIYTWIQTAAVTLDSLLIIGFRAWFIQHIQPEKRWRIGWKALNEIFEQPTHIFFRLSVTQPIFHYAIPLIPLGIAWYLAISLSNFIDPKQQVATCVPNSGQPRWLCAHLRLDLREMFLIRNIPSPSVVNALSSKQEEIISKALDESLGLDLRGRFLRNANFYSSFLPKSDLRGAYLEGAVFIDAMMDGADLRGSHLDGTRLSHAKLNGAKLMDAQMESAQLQGAELMSADLTGANLVGGKLSKAQMNNAVLSEAQLKGAYLYGAHMEDANLFGAHLEGANLQQAQMAGADLREAHLSGADIDGARLEGADLSEAKVDVKNLKGAWLKGANLSHTHLEGTSLWGAQLEGANLEGANLEGADLRHSILIGAKLWGTHLNGAVLWGSLLSDADLRFANLDGSHFEAAMLENAHLNGARLVGASLRLANLRGADLKDANMAWADLTDADLSFADLTDANCLEFMELSGADYIFADGIESTILDINYVAPDVLPESCS